MNQATREVRNNDLSEPAPATTMGAGRVQALDSAKAGSLAVPGSLSFGLRQLAGATTLHAVLHRPEQGQARRTGTSSRAAGPRYADFDPGADRRPRVRRTAAAYGEEQSFRLKKGEVEADHRPAHRRPVADHRGRPAERLVLLPRQPGRDDPRRQQRKAREDEFDGELARRARRGLRRQPVHGHARPERRPGDDGAGRGPGGRRELRRPLHAGL